MASKGVCVLRGAFVEKEKVRVVERTADFPPAHEDALGEVVTSVSPKDGEVKVDGLEPGRAYWAVQVVDGTVRARGFTAHDPAVYKQEARQKPAKPTGAVPAGYADVSVEGARSSSAIPKAHEPQGPRAEAAPYKGVADVRGPLLSDTPMGSAHPAVPDEESPHLPQSEVKKGTQQHSATPLGEATPVGDEPVSQEDVGKRTPQASSTPEGEPTPIPKEDLPKRPRKTAAQRKRSAAAKKAAATRKRKAGNARRSSSRSSGRSGGSRKTEGGKS